MASGTLQPGSYFAGRYEIVRVLGQGGMGAVYEVLHRDTQRRRALKVLLPVLVSDPDARARFAQEASITADIDSEHIVETFDAGVDKDSACPFIVMELLRGESLGERLERKQRHEPGDVVEMLRQVALVLEQTHKRGIIHRDLKPDNLFLARREDNTCRIKVLDFGIAKVLEQVGMSRNTVNIGTPLYMAPEQLDGSKLGAATDLFALTHIAFELLTGESYWEPELRNSPSTMVLLKMIEKGPPEPPHVRARMLGVNVGFDFDAWFLRGIARDPAERFSTARELVESLARAIKQPLTSLDVGRLSLTGLLPAAADRASKSQLLAVPSVASRTSIDGTTRPRLRSHEAFVTPISRSTTKRRSPIFVAMGAGVAAAAAIGMLVLLLVGPKTPAQANGAAASKANDPIASATLAEPIVSAASGPTWGDLNLSTEKTTAAASASNATATPSSKVRASGSARVQVRTAAGKQPCRNPDPKRCRD